MYKIVSLSLISFILYGIRTVFLLKTVDIFWIIWVCHVFRKKKKGGNDNN
jgi:cbb3-type cytochrome oxidase subunit 3